MLARLQRPQPRSSELDGEIATVRRLCRIFLGAASELEGEMEPVITESPLNPDPICKTSLLVTRDREERKDLAKALHLAPHQSRQSGLYTAAEIYACVRSALRELNHAKQELDTKDTDL